MSKRNYLIRIAPKGLPMGFQVGFYNIKGWWQQDSSHKTEQSARERLAWLKANMP